MPPRSTRTFYAVYALLLGLLLIGALEIASAFVLTARGQSSDAHANGRHLYHPYRTHQLNPAYARDFDTGGERLHSADGFRSDAPYARDKPPGVFRVIMLGGSTLYGIGAEAPYPRTPSLANDETVAHFVETALAERLPDEGAYTDVEVINAGVVAYTTFHHLVYLNEVLLEYAPDLLVFLDGHNDFYHYSPYNQWQSYELGTGRLTEHFNARGAWFAALGGVRFLARHSRFFLVVERYMEGRWRATGSPRFAQASRPREAHGEDDPARTLTETVIRSHVQIDALAELSGFDTVVFLQPEIVLEDASVLSDADRTIKALTERLDDDERRQEVRAGFPALFAGHDIDYVDIGEIATPATRDVQLYVDYCHLTAAGSAAVAARMMPELERRLATRLAAADTARDGDG